MKIVHICLSGPYTDDTNYQENILSKYHKLLGNEVTVIASNWAWSSEGYKIPVECRSYQTAEGVKVIRIPVAKGTIDTRLRRFPGMIELVRKEMPDILFIHDCQYLDIIKLASFACKTPSVRVYVDNHADFSNSATNWISKNILHKILWRHCARKIEPYTTKFFGVLPARVEFLVNMYGIPKEKVELLVMGADDDVVEEVRKKNIRNQIRRKYSIDNKTILLVTGGKINHFRPEMLNLLEVVAEINDPHVKILFFGNVSDEYSERFQRVCLHKNIINAGWLSSRDTYGYMDAGDLIIFPGLHSVLWEQAVGMGKACMFRKITGFDHVNKGKNCIMLSDISFDGLRKEIMDVLIGKNIENMTKNAEKSAILFSYREIAKRSIYTQI